jgi:hypothetical protein
MTYADMLQQGFTSYPQQMGQFGPQNQWGPQLSQLYNAALGAPSLHAASSTPGQAAYGQQYGQYGAYGAQPGVAPFGYNAGWGGQPQWGAQQPQQQWGAQPPQWWGQQRQLSQQEVSEVVRQLLPALPQIIAQAQQPNLGLAYAAYGQTPRTLTQQDVNDVVRQLLPLVPQIVGALQGQPQLQYAAFGAQQPMWQQQPLFHQQQPFLQQALQQQPFQQQLWPGQYGAPQLHAAFGGQQQWGQPQRPLTQQDVTDVTRQLAGLIPQVIGNLQAFNQQRLI